MTGRSKVRVFLWLFVLLSVTVQADIYKWTDERGRVHYGDKPSQGARNKVQIKTTPAPPTATKPAHNRQAIKNWVKAREQERRRANEEAARQKRQRLAILQECNRLKSRLADLERGGTAWYELKKNGDKRYYSDDEIKAEINRRRTEIKQNCR